MLLCDLILHNWFGLIWGGKSDGLFGLEPRYVSSWRIWLLCMNSIKLYISWDLVYVICVVILLLLIFEVTMSWWLPLSGLLGRRWVVLPTSESATVCLYGGILVTGERISIGAGLSLLSIFLGFRSVLFPCSTKFIDGHVHELGVLTRMQSYEPLLKIIVILYFVQITACNGFHCDVFSLNYPYKPMI
jgi:hypothetical protein